MIWVIFMHVRAFGAPPTYCKCATRLSLVVCVPSQPPGSGGADVRAGGATMATSATRSSRPASTSRRRKPSARSRAASWRHCGTSRNVPSSWRCSSTCVSYLTHVFDINFVISTIIYVCFDFLCVTSFKVIICRVLRKPALMTMT